MCCGAVINPAVAVVSCEVSFFKKWFDSWNFLVSPESSVSFEVLNLTWNQRLESDVELYIRLVSRWRHFPSRCVGEATVHVETCNTHMQHTQATHTGNTQESMFSRCHPISTCACVQSFCVRVSVTVSVHIKEKRKRRFRRFLGGYSDARQSWVATAHVCVFRPMKTHADTLILLIF